MNNNIVHVDIGLSEDMAYVLGEQPSIEILCLAEDGDSIRDSLTAIQSVGGGPPAACNCGKCKRIVEMLEGGSSLARARKVVLGR